MRQIKCVPDEGCPHPWTVSQYHCVLVGSHDAADEGYYGGPYRCCRRTDQSEGKHQPQRQSACWSRGLDGGVCAEVEHPLGLSALESRWRCWACCCSVSHADVISSITTIQYGDDSMTWAGFYNHQDLVSLFKLVVCVCVFVVVVAVVMWRRHCVCVGVCVGVCEQMCLCVSA